MKGQTSLGILVNKPGQPGDAMSLAGMELVDAVREALSIDVPTEKKAAV